MSYLEECIEDGIRKGLDVSWFTKEDWDRAQLYEIKWGLLDGLEVSKYAKKEFNERQMEQIRMGLMRWFERL